MKEAPRLTIKGLKSVDFEGRIDGKRTSLFELNNKTGMRVFITNYGARVVSIQVLDAHNGFTDVVAGFESIDDYLRSTEVYYGAIIGRYCNRIADGLFTLHGNTYTLAINNGCNTLHGGKKGCHNVIWDVMSENAQCLVLSYLSRDGEEGFPGNLMVNVTYRLTDDNCLRISYEANTDKTTVVNLTNHAFFNLNGEGNGSVLNHQVQIKADHYTPVDMNMIPTGEIETVVGTPFDFRNAAILGSRINDHSMQLKNGKGYDHNFVINKHAARTPVARVKGDISGIVMEVFTDQPGLQLYSGNFMEGKNILKWGAKDEYRTAFAMETQHFPDSPNKPSFPSTELRPGQSYKSSTCYKFCI